MLSEWVQCWAWVALADSGSMRSPGRADAFRRKGSRRSTLARAAEALDARA